MPCAIGVFLQEASEFRHHSHQTSLDVCEMDALKNELFYGKKVQVGKDQEKAQSEKDFHSKNRGGKTQTNNKVLIQ